MPCYILYKIQCTPNCSTKKQLGMTDKNYSTTSMRWSVRSNPLWKKGLISDRWSTKTRAVAFLFSQNLWCTILLLRGKVRVWAGNWSWQLVVYQLRQYTKVERWLEVGGTSFFRHSKPQFDVSIVWPLAPTIEVREQAPKTHN